MLTVNGLSLFRYELCEAGEIRAVVRWPFRPAMGRNAAFSLGANGHVEIDAGSATYRIEFVTFDAPGVRRRLYRFFLMQGEATLATAESAPGRPRSWHLEAGPATLRLVERSSWFTMRFDIENTSRAAGRIRETTRFLGIRRRYAYDAPREVDLPVQAFLFFLAANATYR